MSKHITFVFPDTNLFLQCRSLGELDWDLWEATTEIRLVVCKAVQREIDALKSGGNTRKASRARSVASLFRKIIRNTASPVVRASHPVVLISINPECVPSPELRDSLDYSERDDQLVGTVYAFRQEHQGREIELLTDDVTVLSTARSLGIPSKEIPDSWLLPPERSPQDREMDRLKSEITALRAREPVCVVHCHGPNSDAITRFSGTHYRFLPLSQAAVSDLTKAIQQRFPMKRTFSLSPDPPGTIRIYHEYSAPSRDQIDAYVKDYKKWANTTSQHLRSFHEMLQGSCELPRVTFTLKNDGTRPAKDAVVTFSASGNFSISAVDKPEPRTPDADSEEPVYRITSPPNPPKGRWVRISRGFLDTQPGDLEVETPSYLTELIEPLRRLDVPDVSYVGPRETDLFYGDGDVTSAQETLRFTCSQWRHAGTGEQFLIDLHPDLSKETAGGLLTCRIEAENLAEPKTFRLRLNCTIESVDSFEQARQAVDAVIRGVR